MHTVLTFFSVSADCASKSSFFGIPTWYQYLKVERITSSKACELNVSFTDASGKVDFTTISLIGLAIIDILLRVGALVAVGYVIYGGIQYVTSQGEPDKTKQAGSTISNAVIGLIITIIAAAFVRFIGNRIGA